MAAIIKATRPSQRLIHGETCGWIIMPPFEACRPCDQVALGRRRATRYEAVMKLRTRKAVGILLTLAYLVIYCLVGMAIGGVFILGKGPLAEISFYVIVGLGWLPIEMVIIKWMSKPDPAC
jgi:Protein of unknown function (DUF2842)